MSVKKEMLKQVDINTIKNAYITDYDDSCAVDEMRKKSNQRAMWDHLPYQDIHSKLDRLEKNFLLSSRTTLDQKQDLSEPSLALARL